MQRDTYVYLFLYLCSIMRMYVYYVVLCVYVYIPVKSEREKEISSLLPFCAISKTYRCMAGCWALQGFWACTSNLCSGMSLGFMPSFRPIRKGP